MLKQVHIKNFKSIAGAVVDLSGFTALVGPNGLPELGVETYFCDVRSPWKKVEAENATGRLRRELPRKTDLDEAPDEELTLRASRCNNTSRSALGYRTPADVFGSSGTVALPA